jgi:aminoglycoside phosphotransferase (APT) family kinase protein
VEFQEPVSAADIEAMVRRAFGAGTSVESAVELTGGRYNSTYKLALAGLDPVVLRVAPHESRQFRAERHFMRNEHASVPWLAPIADLMPRTLAVDFTHQVVDRDWLIQTFLDGRVAGDGFRGLPVEVKQDFWRQLGTLTRSIHTVVGPHFGPLTGPAHSTWSAAFIAGLDDIVADLSSAALDATDVRRVIDLATRHAAVLDEITSPRLLHGDLWLGNLLVDEARRITGVLDSDRTVFGDPMADWNVFLIGVNAGMDAFWETYGPRPEGRAAGLRARLYEARFIGGIRLERHRLGESDRVADSYPELAAVVAAIEAA